MSESFQLFLDAQRKLTLKRDGHDDVADVRVRRAFPWSRPDRFISIRSSEGKELVLVEDLATLPAEQRTIPCIVNSVACVDAACRQTVFGGLAPGGIIFERVAKPNGCS